ncbi:MAG: Mur ligase, partial [Luteimonas sp.]|nr:Mur ligase [Luteimonas sp.]
MLETASGLAFDDAALERWRANVAAARAALGWPQGEIVARKHRTGASLAFAAPLDQLYAATEVNEWAWASALTMEPALLHAPGHAAPWDADSALHSLRALAAAEANPALLALRDAADARSLPFLPDDDELSIGAGVGGRTWPVTELPTPDQVEWNALHAIPTAL